MIEHTPQSPSGSCGGEPQLLLFNNIYMNEKRIIDMMQRIDLYIRGKLNQQEIDELWIEFLKEPEWYKIFETDLHIRAIAK